MLMHDRSDTLKPLLIINRPARCAQSGFAPLVTEAQLHNAAGDAADARHGEGLNAAEVGSWRVLHCAKQSR